jgi:transcriptional regulator with XRE-family HTH domain
LTLVLGHVFNVVEPLDPALGALLKRLRKEREVTQEKLAFDADITVSALSRIERGLNSPGWMTIVQITRALGVSLVQLGAELEGGTTDASHEPSDPGLE